MLLSKVLALLLPLAAEGAAAKKSRFTYYTMPTALSGPCDLCTGPDGNIWVSELAINKIARVNPRTGKVKEFDIPYTLEASGTIPIPPAGGVPGFNRTAFACVAQPGADGNVYFATGLRNQFARINPKTEKVQVFTPPNLDPTGNLLFLNDAYRYKDAMYFTQTTGGNLVRFDYKTEKFEIFPVPGLPRVDLPVGVYWASDNGIWVASFGGQAVHRFDPVKKTFRTCPIPPSGLGPAVIRAETERKYVWATGFLSNSMVRVTMKNCAVKVFPNNVPTSFPTEDTVDNKGFVWFSTLTQNTLNRLNTQTGAVRHIRQPGTPITTPVSVPPYADVASHWDNYTHSIWFTEVATNRVGRYQLNY